MSDYLRPLPWPMKLAIAAGSLMLAALASEILFRLTGTTRISAPFLAAVVVTAVFAGRGPALLLALVSPFLYDLFLERDLALRFSSEEVVNVAVFAAAALLIGELVGKARDEAERVAGNARASRLLFSATRRFSETSEEEEIWQALHDLLRSATGSDDVFLVERGGAPIPPSAAPPGDAARLAQRSLSPLAGGDVQTVERWSAKALAGEDRPCVAIWPAAGGDDLSVTPILPVLVDLGAAAASRARLATARAAFEASRREEAFRDALISSVSHDFRTPLAAIIGSANNLVDYGDRLSEEDRQDLLLNIRQEGVRLSHYVNNILDYSRIQSGQVRLDLHPSSLVEVARNVAHRIASLYPGRRLKVEGEESASAMADSLLLDQALFNIVDNGLKFAGDGGEVRILVRGQSGRAMIEVVDNGPGLAPGARQLIFRKFHSLGQPDGGRRGAGLGLTIAKGFIDAMGGTIEAQARLDGRQGLRMIISLPSGVSECPSKMSAR